MRATQRLLHWTLVRLILSKPWIDSDAMRTRHEVFFRIYGFLISTLCSAFDCVSCRYDRCQNMKIYAQTYLREEGNMRQSVRVTDTQEAYSTLQVKA